MHICGDFIQSDVEFYVLTLWMFCCSHRTSPSAWVYNLTLNYTTDLLFGRRKYKSFQQSAEDQGIAIDIQLLVMKQTTQTGREPSNYSHLISQTKLHDSKNGV